ncbi:MAG: hypothetical protein EOP10_22075 [Proteobacteria bacterium]|nr:MAG: hypothetical protein EOP10_22075 [Pseudomonadota bacterium]
MNKRTITHILCLTLYMFLKSTASAAPLLVDRLIVEISGKSYSQKQLEVYGLIRTIAMGEAASLGLPTSERWPEQVETFKNEMIIVTQLENDQTKLDSFLPEASKVSDAVKALNAVQGKDSAVDAFIRGRSLSESEITKTLTTIFRVEGYTRSRLQLSQTRSLDDQGPSFIKLDPNAEWFLSLQKATAFRYYSQAKEYRALSPLR